MPCFFKKMGLQSLLHGKMNLNIRQTETSCPWLECLSRKRTWLKLLLYHQHIFEVILNFVLQCTKYCVTVIGHKVPSVHVPAQQRTKNLSLGLYLPVLLILVKIVSHESSHTLALA